MLREGFLRSCLRYISEPEAYALVHDMVTFASMTTPVENERQTRKTPTMRKSNNLLMYQVCSTGMEHLRTSLTDLSPPQDQLPIIRFVNTRLPFGGYVITISMNEKARDLWGYSREMPKSAEKHIFDYSDFKPMVSFWKYEAKLLYHFQLHLSFFQIVSCDLLAAGRSIFSPGWSD